MLVRLIQLLDYSHNNLHYRINRQLERLTSGDADALEKVLEDRLDRLYVAKVYLQSDAATANTEALRQVVDDLADTEYEKHRATDVDGETERGQIH